MSKQNGKANGKRQLQRVEPGVPGVVEQEVVLPGHTGLIAASIPLTGTMEFDLIARRQVKANLASVLMQSLSAMIEDGRAYAVELRKPTVSIAVEAGEKVMEQELGVYLAYVPDAMPGEYIYLKSLPGFMWVAPEGAVIEVGVATRFADDGVEVIATEKRYFMRDGAGFKRLPDEAVTNIRNPDGSPLDGAIETVVGGEAEEEGGRDASGTA